MNANELADEVEGCEPYNIMDRHLLKASATMLRKQQAEIEDLKILFDKALNNWAKHMERYKND